MLDRLSLVIPRLAVSAAGADGAATSALADLRVGVNIIGLQRDAMHLPEQLRRAIRTMLDAIASHYRRRNLGQADAALLGIIDRVIATVVQDRATMTRELLLQARAVPQGSTVCPRDSTRSKPVNDYGARMSSEVDVYGVFVPTLLVCLGATLPLTAGLRRLLRWCGFYSLVWHRPLLDLALLVIVLGAVVAASTRWVAL